LTTEPVIPNFSEENPMPEITGKLPADLHPNGTVRMFFIAQTGGGNECPITAKDLAAAEMDFVRMSWLPPERAAALRAELDRNKVVSAETSIDAAVAANKDVRAQCGSFGSPYETK
jgi:hypothetical protein